MPVTIPLDYAAIFNAASNGMAFSDAGTGEILDANAAWVHSTGLVREQMIGRTAFDLGIWERKADREQCLSRLAHDGQVVDFEARLVLQRVARPHLISARLVEMSGRRCVLWEFRDVTERKQAEEDLRDSEARFRDIFNAVSEALFVHDSRTGALVDVNRSMCELYGYSREEVLQLGPAELSAGTPPHSPAEALALLQRAVTEGPQTFEWIARARGGRLFWTEVRLCLARIGRDERILAVVSDISRRKEISAALAESEARLRLALDAAAMWAWRWDVDSGRTIWGDDPQGLLGPHPDAGYPDFRDMVIEEDRESFLHAARAARDGRGDYLAQFRLRRTDGALRWLLARGRVVTGPGGTVSAIIGVTQDITERKIAEAARSQLETQLRESQKMEALGTLAGGVAHDFNNALALILGNVELARQDIGPGHVAQVSLEEIAKASRRARDLVQQILAFGRRQSLERKAMALALVVIESARLIRATLPETVSLDLDCKPDAPAVLADATQVKQVLLNLCSNALQAIQEQARPGTIEIVLANCALSEARGELRAGRYACLTVRDNGPGMDETTRARIFEPFFTTKPVGKGTGLGLSVVHGIVQAHDAFIEVQSTPGGGSEFQVYFPAVDVAVATGPGDIFAGAHAPAAGQHVLYVDDEDAIIFLMKRLLERRGYRVSGYTDPRAALAAARADPGQFDLVVTDYNMPGISGLEVARALASIRADLPIVMASGYITEDLRQSAPAAGIRELIYKPDTVEDLCEAVARFASAQYGGRRQAAGERPAAAH